VTTGKSLAFLRASRARNEGRFAIVTNVGAGCDGRALVHETNAPERGRQSRVVLAPRRWREVDAMLTHRDDDGDKKPDRRRERGISRKAIVQGMPDCFGEPVVD